MPSNNRRLIALVGLLAIIAVGAGTILYTRDYYRPESVAVVGHPLPPLALTDLEGEPVDFDAFRGRMLLATFIQLDCGHCHDQLAVLEKLREEFDDSLGIVVISTDTPTRAVGFLGHIPVSFPVWVDSRRGLYKMLGAINVPALFLLDADGILRHTAAGYQSFQDVRKMVIGRPHQDRVTSGKKSEHPQ